MSETQTLSKAQLELKEKREYRHKLRLLLEDPAIVAFLDHFHAQSSRKSTRSFIKIYLDYEISKRGEYKWDMLSEAVVNDYLNNWCKLKFAPNTTSLLLGILKGIAHRLNLLQRLTDSEYRLINEIKAPRGKRVPHGRMLNRDELTTLFDYCDKEDTVRGVRDTAIFSMLCFCGLRRAELAGIRLEDLDLDPDVPVVTIIGKGDKQRRVNIPPFAVKRVQKWVDLLDEKSGYLFRRLNKYEDIQEAGLCGGSILRICREYAVKTGLARWSPHDFRRTCASNLIEKGVDLITVRDYLGHSSIGTTQIYDKRPETRLQEVAKNFSMDLKDGD